jgi:hypothetical protein
MSIAPTRSRIIDAFERHREAPGAVYDEEHFLDFLMENPKAKGAIRNSFGGLRRFNAFINDIQYEYGVCFSLADRDFDHSIDTFVERIKKLQKSRQGSLRSLRNQERAGAGWAALIIADVLLLGMAFNLRSMVLAGGFFIAAVVITTAFVVFVRRENVYLRRLRAKIEGTR